MAFLAVLWILRCLNCEGERGPSNMFDLVMQTSSGHKKVSLMTVKIIYNFITFSLIAYGLSFSISLSFLEWIQFLSHTSGKKRFNFCPLYSHAFLDESYALTFPSKRHEGKGRVFGFSC